MCCAVLCCAVLCCRFTPAWKHQTWWLADCFLFHIFLQVDLPKVVKDLRSMHIVRVAAGGNHTLALSSTGGVFSCGNGAWGALGRGTLEGAREPASERGG